MSFVSKASAKKYCSIIGAHFITAPLTFLWVYGNLSAYMDSYFRFACSPRCMDGDSVWILGICNATICPGILLSRLLSDKVGLKWAGVVSSVILNAALFGSAWTVQISVALTTVLLGIPMGLVQGLTTVLAFQQVRAWAPENATLFIATTTVVPTLLSMIQNQVITAVVNPNNLKPDAMQGSRTFFSQPEVLDRVPTVLVVYAAMTLCLQGIGYLLLVPPPQEQVSSVTHETARVETETSERDTTGQHSDNSVKMDKVKPKFVPNAITLMNANNVNGYGTNTRTCSPISYNPESTVDASEENSVRDTQNGETDIVKTSIKPSQALKTPSFYALYLFVVATIYTLILKANFYKQFALLYIHDDRYLTLVGTILPAVAGISRLCVGAALNKRVIAIKVSIVFSLAMNGFLCAFWYFVPHVNAVLYLVFILGLAVVQSVYFVITPVACLEMFGPAHFSTNYGLLFTSLVFVGVLGPVVIDFILYAFGWFWLFESASVLCSVTLIFVVCAGFHPVNRYF